jgi:hypothetical protein
MLISDETNPIEKRKGGLQLFYQCYPHMEIFFSQHQLYEEFKEDKFYESAIFVFATNKTEGIPKKPIYTLVMFQNQSYLKYLTLLKRQPKRMRKVSKYSNQKTRN